MNVKKHPLQILVVDDTAIYRKIIREVINDIPGAEVVGTAYNGLDALKKIHIFQPDLLTLDLEMPEMDGLEVLRQIQSMSLDVGAIIISTHTVEGGEMTIKALNRGAFDVILKPENHNADISRELIRDKLALMLEAYRKIRKNKQEQQNKVLAASNDFKPENKKSLLHGIIPATIRRSEVLAIGASTGGPMALAEMLPNLPADLNVPILIAQHMPAGFTTSLAMNLNRKCALEVREARHKELLSPGTVYIAPGGMHMKVEIDLVGIKHIFITDEETGSKYTPSIDLLFRSVADLYGANATGVIMTGMGNDGLLGIKKMKRNGANVIAQDKESSVVYGMPAKVINAGLADIVVPLSEMAAAISITLQSGNRE